MMKTLGELYPLDNLLTNNHLPFFQTPHNYTLTCHHITVGIPFPNLYHFSLIEKLFTFQAI